VRSKKSKNSSVSCAEVYQTHQSGARKCHQSSLTWKIFTSTVYYVRKSKKVTLIYSSFVSQNLSILVLS